MYMGDRSVRRTTAAETHNGFSGIMTNKCGENASKLRAAIDSAMGQLFVALDRAVYERTMSHSKSNVPLDELFIMKPYKSFQSLAANGSHLEHLHVYSPPSNLVPSEAKTMDFHTDSGFMVAMTRGYYSSTESSYSDSDAERGLYLELSTGQRVKVDADDDALIVMIGAAASTWLEPLLGKPLRPAPHALVAGFSGAHSSVTRSWFGKMYLPPKDALLPNLERARKGQDQMTYGQYRELELSGAKQDKSQSSLPAACEISAVSSIAGASYSSRLLHSTGETHCSLANGTIGVLCWMQCISVKDLSCGTKAVCVDTVTDKVVDGSDHCPEKDKSLCKLRCPAVASTKTTTTNSSSSTSHGFCQG